MNNHEVEYTVDLSLDIMLWLLASFYSLAFVRLEKEFKNWGRNPIFYNFTIIYENTFSCSIRTRDLRLGRSKL